MAAAARMTEDVQKLKDRPTNFPNVSDSLQYSEHLFKDACLALHGIILQDIHRGKKELLKDPKFLQGRLYDTCTYILSRHGKDLEQILLEYEHPKLRYPRSRATVQPKVDLVLAKRRPELVLVSALMIRKGSAGYEPDVREPRSDMARLAYMVLERCCRWGFYLWVGSLEELRVFDAVYSFTELSQAGETKSSQIVLKRDAALLPRVDRPLPASLCRTLLVNRADPEFCLRLYRVEPEVAMWPDKDEDAVRLQDFYSPSSKQLPNSYGTWGVFEQIQNIRRQVIKVRDYTDAALFERAHAMLMMARVMFTDLVVVKKLNEPSIDETNFLKQEMDKLRARIRDGLRDREEGSSEEDG